MIRSEFLAVSVHSRYRKMSAKFRQYESNLASLAPGSGAPVFVPRNHGPGREDMLGLPSPYMHSTTAQSKLKE